jgi:hypothetical protein
VADDAKHFFLVDRFLKKGDGAGGQGFFPEFGGFSAGDENDRGFSHFIDAAEPVENQKAVPRNATAAGEVGWKMDVEDDEVGAFASDATDGGGTIHGGADFVTGGFEFDGDCFEHDHVVIRDEDFRDVRPHGLRGRLRRERQQRSGSDRGKRTWGLEIHMKSIKPRSGKPQTRVDPTRLGFFSEGVSRG